jgi:hypothetical protein
MVNGDLVPAARLKITRRFNAWCGRNEIDRFPSGRLIALHGRLTTDHRQRTTGGGRNMKRATVKLISEYPEIREISGSILRKDQPRIARITRINGGGKPQQKTEIRGRKSVVVSQVERESHRTTARARAKMDSRIVQRRHGGRRRRSSG